MRLLAPLTPRSSRRRLGTWAALAAVSTLVLSGCDFSWRNGYLPDPATKEGQIVVHLWNGAWIAAWAVGALVWGLMIWCMVAYRRRKNDNELPVQLRYNVPIEILYTVVPIFMIAVLFSYTARDEAELTKVTNPPVTINVVGKQWSWDFNYVSPDGASGDVHEVGAQAIMTGKPGTEETIPTLYLPVGEKVQFVLTSRDVIHSFWVPHFLMKVDMIPGRVNRFEVTPTVEGTFKGKCAELCGTYHSAMLFNVEVVSRAEYDAHLKELADKGQTGLLPNGVSRQQLMPGQDKLLSREEGRS